MHLSETGPKDLWHFMLNLAESGILLRKFSMALLTVPVSYVHRIEIVLLCLW